MADASGRFLAIRFPGIGLVLARHTQAVPGSHADAGIVMAAVDARGMQYTLLASVRGFTPAQVEALRADIQESYGRPAEVLRSGPDGAIVRYAWAMKDLRSPILQTLARIQHSFGQLWTHVEGGTVCLYAPIRSADGGRKAIDGLQRHLASVGMPIDLEAVDLGPADLERHARLQALLQDDALKPA